MRLLSLVCSFVVGSAFALDRWLVCLIEEFFITSLFFFVTRLETMNRVSNLFGKAIRETGQAMDRVGLTLVGNEIFQETYSRHRPLVKLFDKAPVVGASAFVAPNAALVGDVQVLDGASVSSKNSIHFFIPSYQDEILFLTNL